jgi:hypothetical protein
MNIMTRTKLFQHFVHNLPTISNRQVVAEQYSLQNMTCLLYAKDVASTVLPVFKSQQALVRMTMDGWMNKLDGSRSLFQYF